MLVYRIEAIDNPRVGAFNGSNGPAHYAREQAVREGVLDPYSHPTPQMEGLKIFYDQHVCGFPHLDAYRTWFVTPTVRKALWEGDTHHMRVYDMPDHLVQVGMLQVVFNPDEAISVRLATAEEIA